MTATRTIYVVVDCRTGIAHPDADTIHTQADAQRVVNELRDQGYAVGWQAYEIEQPRPVRAPKVGRRYSLLRR